MSALKLGFCSHKAARYAVMTWHYSKTMPIGKLVKIGVWEDGAFIGVVLYGRGASPTAHLRYNIHKTQMCELVRVALTTHSAPVSRIVAISFKLLKQSSPKMRLVYSFADPRQGHIGGIYQAGSWIYTGTSAPAKEYYHEGRWKHPREVCGGAFGGNAALTLKQRRQLLTRPTLPKHRYLYPLDKKMRNQIKKLSKPYPKRQPTQRGTEDHSATGGAEPTLTLQPSPAGEVA